MSEASVYVHMQCPGVRANVRVYVLSWGRSPEEPTAHRMGKMAAIESEKSNKGAEVKSVPRHQHLKQVGGGDRENGGAVG